MGLRALLLLAAVFSYAQQATARPAGLLLQTAQRDAPGESGHGASGLAVPWMDDEAVQGPDAVPVRHRGLLGTSHDTLEELLALISQSALPVLDPQGATTGAGAYYPPPPYYSPAFPDPASRRRQLLEALGDAELIEVLNDKLAASPDAKLSNQDVITTFAARLSSSMQREAQRRELGSRAARGNYFFDDSQTEDMDTTLKNLLKLIT